MEALAFSKRTGEVPQLYVRNLPGSSDTLTQEKVEYAVAHIHKIPSPFTLIKLAIDVRVRLTAASVLEERFFKRIPLHACSIIGKLSEGYMKAMRENLNSLRNQVIRNLNHENLLRHARKFLFLMEE